MLLMSEKPQTTSTCPIIQTNVCYIGCLYVTHIASALAFMHQHFVYEPHAPDTVLFV